MDTATPSSPPFPTPLQGLVDSAEALLPEGPGIHLASAAVGATDRALVGRLDVLDTDLPLLRGCAVPLQVVLSGGAGQVAGPAGLCRRLGLHLAGVRVALRDYDDLASNVRRVAVAVEAARSAGDLDDDTPVTVDLPTSESPRGWLAALDEAAAAELTVSFRLGGPHPMDLPSSPQVAEWIDAALDRETPFSVSRGLDRAVRRHGEGPGHGLVNVLLATQAAWDGAGVEAVVELLDGLEPDTLGSHVAAATSARRWFRSASVAPVQPVVDNLSALLG